MLPEASTTQVDSDLRMSLRAAATSLGVMLSSRMESALPAMAWESSAGVRASTWTIWPGWRPARARARTAGRPPPREMWLFLMRIPSCRSRRWLMPPPQQTAYLSRARRPGMVLRVSRILVLDVVAATARTYSLVRVAMPDMRCIRLRMTRSVERMLAALARMTAMAWPFLTRTPSKISGWEMTSKRPTGLGYIFAKRVRKAEIQPMPATTQLCLATMVAVARRAGSMVRAVVMSLAARSSSRAASSRAVMRRLFQSIP